MNEITTQIKDEVRKRVSHPFLSSFFLALASTNYKIFFVLTSDENYRSKFNYIEAFLYPDFAKFTLHLIAIPLIAAGFFVFLWPLIDTEISTISIKLENRKKLKILREERKEPIDKDEQAQYFERQDKEILELKGRLTATRDRETKITKEKNARIEALTGRIKNQAFQILADSAGISNSEAKTIFSLDGWNLRDNHKPLFEAARRIPHIKKIAAVVAAIEKVPLTEDYRKIGDMDWLATVLGESREYAINFHEILYALNIAGDILDEGLTFDLKHHETTQLSKISALAKALAE